MVIFLHEILFSIGSPTDNDGFAMGLIQPLEEVPAYKGGSTEYNDINDIFAPY